MILLIIIAILFSKMNEEVSSEKLIETGSKKLINSEALDNEVQITFFQVFFGDNY
jgi:hypothetical protein